MSRDMGAVASQVVNRIPGELLGRIGLASEKPMMTSSGIEGAAYSADGYTVTTGGSRGAGASVLRPGDPLTGFVAPLGTAMQGFTGAVSTNPIPWVAGAVGVVLIAALLRRKG